MLLVQWFIVAGSGPDNLERWDYHGSSRKYYLFCDSWVRKPFNTPELTAAELKHQAVFRRASLLFFNGPLLQGQKPINPGPSDYYHKFTIKSHWHWLTVRNIKLSVATFSITTDNYSVRVSTWHHSSYVGIILLSGLYGNSDDLSSHSELGVRSSPGNFPAPPEC